MGREMCLLRVLLWFSAIIPDNSRFGRFNSRLGRANSRFGPLREFTGKCLSRLAFFAAKRQFSGQDRENSRLNGNNRDLVRRTCEHRQTSIPLRWINSVEERAAVFEAADAVQDDRGGGRGVGCG